jgi:hypothetical protein
MRWNYHPTQRMDAAQHQKVMSACYYFCIATDAILVARAIPTVLDTVHIIQSRRRWQSIPSGDQPKHPIAR